MQLMLACVALHIWCAPPEQQERICQHDTNGIKHVFADLTGAADWNAKKFPSSDHMIGPLLQQIDIHTAIKQGFNHFTKKSSTPISTPGRLSAHLPWPAST